MQQIAFITQVDVIREILNSVGYIDGAFFTAGTAGLIMGVDWVAEKFKSRPEISENPNKFLKGLTQPPQGGVSLRRQA